MKAGQKRYMVAQTILYYAPFVHRSPQSRRKREKKLHIMLAVGTELAWLSNWLKKNKRFNLNRTKIKRNFVVKILQSKRIH